MFRRILFLLLVGALALSALSSQAIAKTTRTFDYKLSTVWATTIRYIRVDNSFQIVDKDVDTGYILFVYPGTNGMKDSHASIEMVPVTESDGKNRVRLQLNIAQQPTYIEVDFLDKLDRKLVEEQGKPSSPEEKPKQPDPKQPDEPKKD